MHRRTRSAARRDVAFVACLAFVLSVGVLGVLLLNTATQQQSDRLTAQQQRITALSTEAQQLRMSLDLTADPSRLAAAARRLRLRPVTQVRYVGVGRASVGRVSGPRRATGRGRAG